MASQSRLLKWEEHVLPDNTINVLASKYVWDYDFFFSPEKKPFKFFEVSNKTIRISEILLALELAPTRTWCKQNEWDYELEAGYQEIRFGKLKIQLCILISVPKSTMVKEIDDY